MPSEALAANIMMCASTGSKTRRFVNAAPMRVTDADRSRRSTSDTAAAACKDRLRVSRLTRRTHFVSVVEDDFRRVLQILKVHFFHFAREPFILDYRIQFAVSKPARDIEVRTSQRAPNVRPRQLF